MAFNIVPDAPIAEKIGTVVTVLFDAKDWLPELWAKVRRRREAITLEELQKPDWGGFSAAAEAPFRPISIEPETAEQSKIRQESLDYFALILATVFIPLARAEMNRLRRNFNAAIEDYERLLTPYQETREWGATHLAHLRFHRTAFCPPGAWRDAHGKGGGAVQGGVAGQG